jgi:hypothetical protein
MGGYSMSTQSTTVPAVIRLVGAATTGVGIGVAVGAVVGVPVGAAVGVAPVVHAAMTMAPIARDASKDLVGFTIRTLLQADRLTAGIVPNDPDAAAAAMVRRHRSYHDGGVLASPQ